VLVERTFSHKMSPRTSKQYEEIREEKRMLIMDTALRHFAGTGYHSTTIDQIARHAGISKGLMYNYFESKEALLKAIISKSVTEVYHYFDTNRDGYLSEEEFEFFVRQVNTLLKKKRTFWQLLFQLLMQNEVREKFMKTFVGSDSLKQSGVIPYLNLPASNIMKMITDYFIRKQETEGKDYDPQVELNMFLVTLKGFALTSIYSDDGEDDANEKTIERVIELFK
jgi:AcrR family transcriptional regulator